MNDRQRRFVEEYLIDLNATQSAIRAGYSERTALQQGPRLLGNVGVAEAIQAAQAKRSERTEIKADAVLARLWTIATADPRELIEYRRVCCRFCHGPAFRYQRTPSEMARDRIAWQGQAAFDEQGGDGFSETKAPNPLCPECFGEGIERPFVHDTRRFSPAASCLYAGVKVTKEGIEVKMHDQQAALVSVGRHLGLFKDRVEHSGPDGGPLTGVLAIPVALDAAQWAAGAAAQQAALVARPATAPRLES